MRERKRKKSIYVKKRRKKKYFPWFHSKATLAKEHRIYVHLAPLEDQGAYGLTRPELLMTKELMAQLDLRM